MGDPRGDVRSRNRPSPYGGGFGEISRRHTADGVIDIYREEYVIEHASRFMKSGLGIDMVLLQTPSRERAMMFVIAIAALFAGLTNALFRRNDVGIDGGRATMYSMAIEMMTRRSNSTVRTEFCRSGDRQRSEGGSSNSLMRWAQTPDT